MNTGNGITFVAEKMNVQLLKEDFEGLKFVFSAGFNELHMIKIKKPFEDGLSGIIEGRSEAYKERVEDRLYYNICNVYDGDSVGGIPTSTPFQYLYCYHPVCLTDWKKYGLTKGED